LRTHLEDGFSFAIADIEIVFLIQGQAQAKATGIGDYFQLLAIGRDAVDLSRLPAGIHCSVMGHGDTFRMI
jgi:hypothetical protein